MAKELSCPQCAGTIELNQLALRRSYAVCSHCRSVFRVCEEGLTQVSEELTETEAPFGVRVKKDDDQIEITAIREKSTLNTNVRVWVIIVFVISLFLPCFLVITIPLLMWELLKEELIPVTLKNGVLRGSSRIPKSINVSDIKQLYTVVKSIDYGMDEDYIATMVFVLTKDGERIRLIGPTRHIDMALLL